MQLVPLASAAACRRCWVVEEQAMCMYVCVYVEEQAVLGERDALKSSLDEALRRCASSMVSAQLAESSQAHMQEQLTVRLAS